MAGTDPVKQVNQRVEAVVVELARLICEDPDTCPDVMTCSGDKARAVLALLHGAGVLTWGTGHSPLPRPPEGGKQAYAVRVGAEFWHPEERTPDDVANEVTRYRWLPGVLATAAGYDRERITDQVRLFVDELTPEQVATLRPILWQLYSAIDGRA